MSGRADQRTSNWVENERLQYPSQPSTRPPSTQPRQMAPPPQHPAQINPGSPHLGTNVSDLRETPRQMGSVSAQSSSCTRELKNGPLQFDVMQKGKVATQKSSRSPPSRGKSNSIYRKKTAEESGVIDDVHSQKPPAFNPNPVRKKVAKLLLGYEKVEGHNMVRSKRSTHTHSNHGDDKHFKEGK